MNFLSRRAKPHHEAPRQKLSTIYQFRNLRTNYTRLLDSLVKAVDNNVFSFRTVGFLIRDEHHQVTELVLKSLDMAEHPQLNVHIEHFGKKNGVTSFGKGPNPDSTMLVFEVTYTYHTFDWSDLEMPMPVVGKCFLADGSKRELFPGPKFPMSHQLYGSGSEMDMGSTHDTSFGRLEFKAEFEQATWFRQEAYARIVVPGMHVARFLPLSLQFIGGKRSNKLKEPLYLTNIRVELQEFRCVPNRDFELTDIEGLVLSEKDVSLAIDPLNGKIMVPHTMYNCVIPKVGPTFFTGDFTRTYGLNVTLTISSEQIPTFKATAFIELHMAVKKFIRMSEKNVHQSLSGYLGDYGDEFSKRRFFMDDLQRIEATSDGLLSFSRLGADGFTGKFQRYAFLLHRSGEKGCVILSADRTYKSKTSQCEEDGKTTLENPAAKCQMWLKGSSESTSFERKMKPCWETRIIDSPTFGTGTSSDKPHAATCIVVDGQIIEANSSHPILLRKRTFPYPTFRFGERDIPLSFRVVLNRHKHFHQSLECTSVAIVSPGIELSEIVKVTLMVAQGFKEASTYRPVEDTTIRFEHSMITLIEGNYGDSKLSEETILVNKRNLPSIRWSDFKVAVAGNSNNRRFTLPEKFFEGKLPNHLKKFELCRERDLSRSYSLKGRLLVNFLGLTHAFEWCHHLQVT